MTSIHVCPGLIYIKFLCIFYSVFSAFLPLCYAVEQQIQSKLDPSVADLGIKIRGFTLTSNFCPISPSVYSFNLYVQHPGGEEFDNFNTHDA